MATAVRDQKSTKILEKFGHRGQDIYNSVLFKLDRKEISTEQAVAYLLEMTRGDYHLVIDENIPRELSRYLLKEKGYTLTRVPRQMTDEKIRERLAGTGVFITSNSQDFDIDRDVPDPFVRGMIIVPPKGDYRILGDAMEFLLMNWRDKHEDEPVRKRISSQNLEGLAKKKLRYV
ncbi:MAG: hypothetical protein HY000_11075 [Planctomycetes bacterium]|nr:hypothetical protein [Planctomycetota bacterium]